MNATLASRIMRSAIAAGLTTREQLETHRDRVFDRMAIHKTSIKDLHEMLANNSCSDYGLTTDDAMNLVQMYDSWVAMDEDRIEAINDMLGR